MKTDNQHLEYLISQHVDGCLDGASKKSLEQKLMTDPMSRQLYKEQREVQDILDEWGSRIPLINWDDFDRKLAVRLEKETVGGGNISIFKRWARPMAAAAALFVAASVGYAWHAFSTSPQLQTAKVTTESPKNVLPSTPVIIDEARDQRGASGIAFRVDDAPASTNASRGHVAIGSPDDMEAAKALQAALAYGMEGVTPSVSTSAAADATRGPNAAVIDHATEKKSGEKELPAFW